MADLEPESGAASPDEAAIAELVAEASRLRDAIASHRDAISELGRTRRGTVERLVGLIGPTRAAKELGIARQTVYEILNPTVAKERKAKLRRSASR